MNYKKIVDYYVEEQGETLYYKSLDKVYNIDALIDTWEMEHKIGKA